MHANHHLDAALAATRQREIGARRHTARPPAPRERPAPYRLRATITRWISFVPS